MALDHATQASVCSLRLLKPRPQSGAHLESPTNLLYAEFRWIVHLKFAKPPNPFLQLKTTTQSKIHGNILGFNIPIQPR